MCVSYLLGSTTRFEVLRCAQCVVVVLRSEHGGPGPLLEQLHVQLKGADLLEGRIAMQRCGTLCGVYSHVTQHHANLQM